MIVLAAAAAPSWISYAAIPAAAAASASALAVVWNRLHENGKARRRYAERVAAWTGDHAECPDADEGLYHWHDMVVHNGSEQPVYDVVVSVSTPQATDLLEEEKGGNPTAYCAVGLIAPGKTVTRRFGDGGQIPEQYAVPLEVAFTDAQGVRWTRDVSGRLRGGSRRRG